MTEKALAFARMVDSVAINARNTFDDIKQLVADAKKYHYFLIYGVACFNEYMIEQLKGTDTMVGGAVGNATGVGEEPTEFKVAMAKHWTEIGCGELDMFMNIPMLRSGMYDEVLKEVKAIRAAAPSILKVIIHTPLLTDEEIKIASQIVVEGGGDFVKTGSGFYGPTTIEAVKIIKDAIGGKCQIKAAGGVQGLPMIEELKALGVTRFGLSNTKTVGIMEELNK